jgi:hypothetical protein
MNGCRFGRKSFGVGFAFQNTWIHALLTREAANVLKAAL